ncbi:uncharacterized protein VTP21DRAFT_10817 [Calcarisporiella thermophila]
MEMEEEEEEEGREEEEEMRRSKRTRAESNGDRFLGEGSSGFALIAI